VQSGENREMPVGQVVEVVGFPTASGSVRTLTKALVRPAGDVRDVPPQKLNAGEGISFRHAGALVEINANLIAQRTKGGRQVLELQEGQRVFEAELPVENGVLPPFEPGSRLQLSGVCDFAAVTPPPSGNVAAESPSTGALKILLRRPADVVLLSGPPWWTWKQTATLVGTLLVVTVASLLRIHLLRRRLERQLAFSRQILESQESERHRIAANLHDSLGQNLLVIKNQARLAMQPIGSESVLRRRLDEISGCASQAIEEVREITHALRPYQLDRLGLTQTIRATVNRAAENSSISFASHADDVDEVFDKESEIHVYRIVQEAVNNILKHSAATEATVVVKKLAAVVSLSIRDNGRGFDAAAAHDSNSQDVGHGISGIKERVRILGGTFVVDSRPGHGTSLSIEIPVSISQHEAT
jgi:signal transduction histidine kinase